MDGLFINSIDYVASTLLFYFGSLILLHRPFITHKTIFPESANPQSQSSFWICTSAATLGMRIAAPLTVYDFLKCPYAFSLYPVLQFCLIHMYNTKSSDPSISATAKNELEKGITLLDRIHGASSTAYTLRELLHKVMNNKNIDIKATSEEEDAPYAWIIKSLEDKRKKGKVLHMRLSCTTPMSSLLDALALEPHNTYQSNAASTTERLGMFCN